MLVYWERNASECFVHNSSIVQLLGIFDYYMKKLIKCEDINNLISIDVYIYGEKNTINAFKQFI